MLRSRLVGWTLVPLLACADPAPPPAPDASDAPDAGALDAASEADAAIDADGSDAVDRDAADAASGEDGSGFSLGGACGFTTDKLDLLFVVDNSSSMRPEQSLLAAELPAMTAALASGDLDGDGTAELPPTDMHVGVISTDMGTSGISGAFCTRVGDDGLLRTPADCVATGEGFLRFDPEGDVSAADFADALGCQIQIGTEGCGFEQPLDATLRALASSDADVAFPYGSGGHRDTVHAGFVRDDSVLAIIVVTDDDDCSFPQSSDGFPDATGQGPLSDVGNNYRCQAYGELLHPISRYVDTLTALRPELPDSVIFGVLAGVPLDLVDEPNTVAEILEDERMQFEPDGPLDDNTTQPVPGCTVTRDTKEVRAVPARRLLEVAEAFGDHAVVGSICEETFARPVEQIARLIAGVLDCPDEPTVFLF